MNRQKINQILVKISNLSAILLFFLFLLYFLSGYGQTKGIFDPILAKKIHNLWLPIPTFLFFLLHCFAGFKFFLIRLKFKDDIFLNFSLLIFGIILFLIFLYFYFL